MINLINQCECECKLNQKELHLDGKYLKQIISNTSWIVLPTDLIDIMIQLHIELNQKAKLTMY